MMKLGQFRIGLEFTCGGSKWRCTDVGSRVAVAIKLGDHDDDPSWYRGPPYPVEEVAFDECDFGSCEIPETTDA